MMLSLLSCVQDVEAYYVESHKTSSDFQMHCHNHYEIYYFVDGDADYFVEGKQYHLVPNSVLLLAPYVLHGVRVNSQRTYKRSVVHFSDELISLEHRSTLLAPFPSIKSSSSNEVYYTNVQDFLLYPLFEILVHCKNLHSNFAETMIPIHLESLLAQLALMCRTLHQTENGTLLSKTITEVVNYINAHLNEPLTLEGLSTKFFISKNHLNRMFQKTIGTTVFNYIIYKRVGYAQHLLETGMSAKEAAAKVGFNDYSSFYRAYKKITGHSPMEDIT